MRWLRLFFRIFGWLLTPLLAWAASFFGAVGGALIAIRIDDPVRGLIVTAVCGGIAGFVAIIIWLRYLRRSPEVREVLAVTEDGTPDTTELRVIALITLGSAAMAPGVAEAQTLSGTVGRFHSEGRWDGYRLGFGAARIGVVDIGVHSEVFQRVDGADEGFAGLGADFTALRSPRGGPYVVGGLSGGRAALADGRYRENWASWSVGGGYELFPAPFLSFGVESRWRWLTFGKRDGFELSAGVGIHLGGRRGGPPRDGGPAREVPVRPRPDAPPTAVPGGRVPVPQPVPASASANPVTLTDSIVATATSVMGRPYEWGGTGSDSSGFDCSGLIQYAFGRHGITLPRRSVDQAQQGKAVSKKADELRPGDLLTFSNRSKVVTHVGLYIGDGQFIHSATRGVQISRLSGDDPYGKWWYTRWVGVRRLID